jgi:hypothetical protein
LLRREVRLRLSQPLENHQSTVACQCFDHFDVEHLVSMLKS